MNFNLFALERGADPRVLAAVKSPLFQELASDEFAAKYDVIVLANVGRVKKDQESTLVAAVEKVDLKAIRGFGGVIDPDAMVSKAKRTAQVRNGFVMSAPHPLKPVNFITARGLVQNSKLVDVNNLEVFAQLLGNFIFKGQMT